MTTKTKYPTLITQTTGGHYATFTNLNNIKTSTNYAQAHIQSKKKTTNRPSTITTGGFELNIPTGALATKVVVKLKHSKVAINGNTCNIPAPTVGLYDKDTKLVSRKGQAPTTTPTETTISFTTKLDYSIVNKGQFRVKVDYPTNTNEHEGYVRVYSIRIIVTYITGNFQPDAYLVNCYNGDTDIYASISLYNSNRDVVKSTPQVTIVFDEGISVTGWTPDTGESVQRINARTIVWQPGTWKDNYILPLSLSVNVAFPSGADSITRGVTVTESYGNHTITRNCTVWKEQPKKEDEEPEPPSEQNIDDDSSQITRDEVLFLEPNEEFNIDFSFTDYTKSTVKLYCCLITDNAYGGDFEDAAITSCSSKMQIYMMVQSQWIWQTVTLTSGSINPLNYDLTNQRMENKFRITGKGEYCLFIVDKDDTSTVLKRLNICVKPSTLTAPNATILVPSQEELNRLGDGYSYTAQTFFKILYEDYVRDWDINYRIGVFNNSIGEVQMLNIDDELIEYDPTPVKVTPDQIIKNAEYWSEAATKVDEYNNLTCEFQYDKKYPLYIIITGDFPESGILWNVKFTEPCLTETAYYTEQTINGTYPIPINNLLTNSSEINIPALNKSSTIVFYDLPLDEDFGTNDEIAIRGLALKGIFEQNTDDLVLYANLVNDKKESRQRSIILDQLNPTSLNNDNQFHIGQSGDLWGYKPQDIQHLDDWEVHLTLSNHLNDYTGTANFGNIQLEVYVETIEPQSIRCTIDGEDLSYYGVFIQDIKIPEGLKTETSYLDVDGTDVNDPYRQNIKSKTIKIEFDIGDNCDLEGATLSLRELTRLLTNRRDKYNRPIPKRIEFSHYPDVYWEYIMEEPLDNEVAISSYNAKAKLTIPAGTSYDRDLTSTNTTGFVSGLAAIRPVIQVSPTENVFSIEETITEQEFNMGYSGEWNGKLVEIDCDDRIVWLKENEEDTDPINISKYVDFNSDFFTLYEEYNFTSNGCLIRSIDYSERW